MPRLAEIMRPEPIVVAPEDTLGEVAERMTAVNVGAVIVKDFGRMIGILTERDMLKAMAARVHTSEARVRQWMTLLTTPLLVTVSTLPVSVTPLRTRFTKVPPASSFGSKAIATTRPNAPHNRRTTVSRMILLRAPNVSPNLRASLPRLALGA